MKKLAVVAAGALCLLTAAVLFLLTTGAGLRWTVDQVLTRAGLPVEIDEIDGRILGPLSLTGVRYRDPVSGAGVRVDTIELDWHPRALLGGLLHIARLRTVGIAYTPATSTGPTGTFPRSLPLPAAVRVERLEVESLAIGGGARSRIHIERGSMRGELDADSLTLERIDIDAGPYGAADGRIRLGLKSPLPLEASVDWRMKVEGLPRFKGELSVSGDLNDTVRPVLALDAPFLARAEGTVNQLFETPRWTVTAKLPEAVSLDSIMPQWPALSIQGIVHAQGDDRQAGLQPELNLAFQGIKTILSGEAALSRKALLVARARLTRSETLDTVEFAGNLEFAEALPFAIQGHWQSLRGPDVAPWSSRRGEFEATGDTRNLSASLSGVVTPPGQTEESPVRMDVHARGLAGDLALTGSTSVPYLRYDAVVIRDLVADVDFHSVDPRDSEIVVKASALQTQDDQLTDVELRAGGSLAQHDLSLAAHHEDWSVEAGVTGGYLNDRWRARLRRLSVASTRESLPAPWELEQAADLVWSPTGFGVARLCLRHQRAHACAEGQFTDNADWDLDLEVAGLPLNWLATDTPSSLTIEGAVAGRVRAGGRGDGIEGKASARVEQAVVEWRTDDPATTRYRDIDFTATLNPETLGMQLRGFVNESGTINGELTTSGPFAADGAVQGMIAVHLPSLRLVQTLAPALGVKRGAVNLELSVDGVRSAPQFSGQGRIEDATLEIAPLGIQLSELNLDVRSSDNAGLTLSARAGAGDGRLTGQGFLEWPPGGGWRGEFALRGDRAELVRLPQALIDGNPDLTLAIDKTGGAVNGRIHITRAELTPDAGRPRVTFSDDIVIIGKDSPEQATQNPMVWHANIAIDLGPTPASRGTA